MKKTFVLIVFVAITSIIFIVQQANSQTTVSGNQSGTWVAVNSPYNVTGNVIVPSGQVLTIEAGVEVNFQGYYKIIVLGTLNANGNETDSVFFTTNNQATGWGGISLGQSIDGNVTPAGGISGFSYCRFEFGKTLSGGDYPDTHGGAIKMISSDATYSNCVFADNDATSGEGMGGAIYAINTGSVDNPLTLFTDCIFLRNKGYSEGGAIKFTSDHNTEITNCEFIDNYTSYGGGAIMFYSVVDTKIINCLFANNYSNYSNGGAIETLGNGNTLFFKNCTMVGNEAVYGSGGAAALYYATVDFVNCIIYNNTSQYDDDNVYVDAGGGSATVNYCNINMPDYNTTGANNIESDPLFIDAANGNYQLQNTSPCINAGIDIGLPFYGTAPDMGCFEYHPEVALTADWTVNNSFCEGNTIVFTDASYGGATINNWAWYVNGVLMSSSNSFTYTFPLETTSVTVKLEVGDSNLDTDIKEATITIYPLPNVTIDIYETTICQGSSLTLTASGANTYSWNSGENTPSINPTVSTEITFTVTGTDANQCQNTASSTVHINPAYTITDTVEICDNETYTWIVNGQTYSTTGVYTKNYTTSNGCDSIYMLDLTVNPTYVETDSVAICNGETYTFGTQSLTDAGEYTEMFQTVTGCDSVVTLSLTVNPTYAETDSVAICNGETYTFGTQSLVESGEYTETFQTISGCDSVVTLSLTVNPIFNEISSVSICDDEIYMFGTQSLTDTGEYIETFQTVTGCDSVVNLTLTVNPTYAETDSVAICNGETYTFGTQSLVESGEYTETFQTVTGCDSIITLTLKVNSVETGVLQDGVVLTATASDANYQWITCGNELIEISGETNQIFTAAENGDYAVVITENSCIDTSACYTVTGISILEFLFNEDFTLFPNPTNGNLTIDTKIAYSTMQVNVFNIAGQKVYNQIFESEQILNIELNELTKGIYTLKVQSGNKTAVYQIIKE